MWGEACIPVAVVLVGGGVRLTSGVGEWLFVVVVGCVVEPFGPLVSLLVVDGILSEHLLVPGLIVGVLADRSPDLQNSSGECLYDWVKVLVCR